GNKRPVEPDAEPFAKLLRVSQRFPHPRPRGFQQHILLDPITHSNRHMQPPSCLSYMRARHLATERLLMPSASEFMRRRPGTMAWTDSDEYNAAFNMLAFAEHPEIAIPRLAKTPAPLGHFKRRSGPRTPVLPPWGQYFRLISSALSES